MISQAEAARLFGVSEPIVQALCGYGLVVGAESADGKWFLPEGTTAIGIEAVSAFCTLLEREEHRSQFQAFDADTAWVLGNRILELSKQRGFSTSTEIWRNGFCIFRFCMDGTNPQNDRWLARKRKTVDTLQISSLLAAVRLEMNGESLRDTWLLDPQEFTTFGGGFPLILRGGGVIGSVLVSGSPHEQDHHLIVDAIASILK